MRIVFEVLGDRQVSRDILRVGERAQDATPVFESILAFMIGETRDQFQTEGRHGSGGWAPLKPATLAAKRRKGERLAILQATGALMRSLTDRGDGNMIVHVSPSELEWGSRVGYAEFHRTGTRRMPRRRPVEFTEPARREIVKRLQRYLVTGEVAA